MKQTTRIAKSLRVFVILGLFCGCLSKLPAESLTPHYKLTLLPFQVQAINDRGLVCGTLTVSKKDPQTHQQYYENGHLAIFVHGRVRDLGKALDTDWCGANAVNNHGAIVGVMGRSGLGQGDGPPVYILLWSRGKLHNIGIEGEAKAINDRGQVVGQKEWTNGKYGHENGFLYQTNQFQEIAGSRGQEGSELAAINNKGQMLGVAFSPRTKTWYAFLAQKGHVVEISLPRQYGVDAQHSPALNDLGQVMLNAEQHAIDSANPYLVDHCYSWQSGKARDIGSLPGFTDMNGVTINRQGDIIGNAIVTGSHYKSHPFLWRRGVLYDLNDLVSHAGWKLLTANGFNNRGQIIGQGGGSGKEYNFLLTPIIKP